MDSMPVYNILSEVELLPYTGVQSNSFLYMLYYCYIHAPMFRIVWLLLNLSLGGKLCLRDDKNTAFVQVHHPLPLQANIENVTIRARIGRKLFLIG